MIRGKLATIFLGASLLACVISYAGGRIHQINIQYAQRLENEKEGLERAAELEQELVSKEEEFRRQIEELESLAYENPPITNDCFSADRVRRLNRIR